MRGLVKKDLLVLARTLPFLLIYAVIMGVIGFSMSLSFVFGTLSVMAAIMPASIFTADATSNWEAYSVALPVRRGDIVLSRYMTGTLIIAMVAVMELLMTVVYVLLRTDTDFMEYLYLIGLLSLVGLLLNYLSLPLFFKFGAEKGRIILFSLFGAAYGLLILVTFLEENMGSTIPAISSAGGIAILAAVVLITAIGSIMVSRKVIRKRDY